jgi:hypothetical protein
MEYPKLKAALERHGVTGEQVQEILEAYADDTESAEPYAVNAIEAAKEIGMDIMDLAAP